MTGIFIQFVGWLMHSRVGGGWTAVTVFIGLAFIIFAQIDADRRYQSAVRLSGRGSVRRKPTPR